MAPVERLTAAQVRRETSAAQFPFATTESLTGPSAVIGQPRAEDALRFGVGMRFPGYNIFASGPAGAGKLTLVRHIIGERAAGEPAPFDWCYVNNFDQPYRPKALRLPAGQGRKLRRVVETLVQEMHTALATTFEGSEYQERKRAVEAEAQEQQQQRLAELQEAALKHGLALLRTPEGLAFAPLKEGAVLQPEEFEKLPLEEQKTITSAVELMQDALQKVLAQGPRWERELRTRIRQLNREVATAVLVDLHDDIEALYTELPEVLAFLQAMRKDVIDNLPGFLTVAERPTAGSDGQPTFSDAVSPLRRYHVNLMVDSAEQTGAPVVYESNPTYLNLTGRVEQMAHMGTLVTDFTLIKPGALHRANGGYLILDAAKVLMAGLAWDGLKRALQFGEIRLETPGQMMSLSSTVSLEPEPIPLDVKVVLLGDPSLNYLLSQADPDFDELFKVLADFDNVVVRAGETELAYAQLIASIVAREHLRPLDGGAVARVVDEMARLVDDNERLSTHMQSLVDLLMEADHFAGELTNGAPPAVVDRAAVERAISSRFFRQNRIAERMREQMLRQTIKIDTGGSRIGRINGLSVLQMGGFAFGQPSCISATVRLGNGNVVAIDREVKLSGAIHDKGVLILSSFLQARYSLQRPLAFAASLVFEQNYGGVDGDSATSTELYALLSAIAEVPLRQSLAVTGSMNQHGEVQAIGGVNEKIEGFFDLCSARGLSGEQGVLIPAANVPHLMVRPDVVAAIAAGTFHIYPIQHVDEGIELLTGLPAGELDGRSRYPAGSVNYLVHERLTALAKKRVALDRQMGGRREKGAGEEEKQ